MRLLVTLLLLTVGSLNAQDPVDSRGWMNRGVQAFKNNQYGPATESFRKAVELDPASVTARLYLATAYLQQYIPGSEMPENLRMAAAALEHFTRALELEPGNRTAMASIASLYLNQKKWDDAQQWFEKLIAADPNNASAYYTLGFIAWSRWYPAYGEARTKLGMRPETPGPIPDPNVRAELRASYGRTIEEGLANLQRALDVSPEYDDAMAYMNLLIRERADLRDTREEYSQDIRTADQWIQKALEIKRQKQQSAGPPRPSDPGVAPQRIKVGGNVQEQMLVNRVEPVYPPLAQQARISGVVRLDVIIDKEGHVAHIQVVSGHPLLVPPALEAVKQWVYKPTLLNGNPVEVETTVAVNFGMN